MSDAKTFRDNWEADAEFIAHAREDIPALVGALQAVLALVDGWGDVPGHTLGWEGLAAAVRVVVEDAT